MDAARKPYEGPEPYIFISYARKDKDRVFPLLDALCGAGYRVWYDVEGIPWSADWAEVIADHITRSAVCLAFHSEASKDSRNCREEVYFMLGERKPLVSVYVDGVQFTGALKMRLSPYESVKLSQFADAAKFVERMGKEAVFKSCCGAGTGEVPRRTAVWRKSGKIQWRLDADGVLTIAKNAEIRWLTESIPNYEDIYHKGDSYSTAPWMPYREQIQSAVIQGDIDKIGDNVFRGCHSLSTVHISEGVKTIGMCAFYGCDSLTAVEIPASVTTIGKGAFGRCWNLTAVHIPASVTIIGEYAFIDCNGLPAIEIPASVTTIGKETFMNCENLTSIVIPASVITIGDAAFARCYWLTTIHIPNSVTTIGGAAFSDCYSLTTIHIPNSVTTIGGGAFWGCESLTTVEIPAGTEVHPLAFDAHTRVTRRGMS